MQNKELVTVFGVATEQEWWPSSVRLFLREHFTSARVFGERGRLGLLMSRQVDVGDRASSSPHIVSARSQE